MCCICLSLLLSFPLSRCLCCALSFSLAVSVALSPSLSLSLLRSLPLSRCLCCTLSLSLSLLRSLPTDVGWPGAWDEWLPRDSPRLQPLHTYTRDDGSSIGPDGRDSTSAATATTTGWSQDFTDSSSGIGFSRGLGTRGNLQFEAGGKRIYANADGMHDPDPDKTKGDGKSRGGLTTRTADFDGPIPKVKRRMRAEASQLVLRCARLRLSARSLGLGGR